MAPGSWSRWPVAGGELKKVKPFTLEERAEIDNELTDKSVAFIKEQSADDRNGGLIDTQNSHWSTT